MRLLVALVSATAFFSYSQPQLQVVTEEWLPYNYTNADGEIVGRATKKVREILAQADISYEIRSYPWLRSMHLAQTQPNTMIYSIFRSPEREELFQWACPLMQPVKEYLFKLRSRQDIQLTKLEDAKEYLVSLVRGSASHNYFEKQGFRKGINLDLTADPGSSPRKLLAGRVDLVAMTEYTASERSKELGVPFATLEKALEVKNASDRRACLAFSHSTDKYIVETVRKALAEHNRKHIGP